MRKYLLLLLSSTLIGCNTPSVLKGSGEVAPAPIGHTVACMKDPSLYGCPK
jgi:hypothetical protein